MASRMVVFVAGDADVLEPIQRFPTDGAVSAVYDVMYVLAGPLSAAFTAATRAPDYLSPGSLPRLAGVIPVFEKPFLTHLF